MKDAPLKPSQISLMPKTKVGIKKEKIVKKMKDQKITAPKSNKGKKNSVKNAENKTKSSKEGKETVPKRKRGRPRNDEKNQNSKKIKDQGKGNKKNEVKSVGRKRKIPQTVIKIEKDFSIPPQKKPKILDMNYNASMNGNTKTPPALLGNKSWFQKGESPTVVEHTVSNSINSNGTLHKKTLTFGTKKPGSILKSATFIPPPSILPPPAIPKKEMVNGNSWLKPLKVPPFKTTTKPVIKKEIEIPKDIIKDIKVEKVNNVFTSFREPVKSHPQRMASLDAMAKMHVICTTDRRPPEHHPKTTSVVTICSQPFGSEKSLTQCHERIQFDLKKESKDFKGSIVHKQINYVKEKQEVIVSHSVEQSSILEREKLKNSSFKSDDDCVKKKKSKSSQKCLSGNSESTKSVKFKQNSSEKNSAKSDKTKSKTAKNKVGDKKIVKVQNKGILKTTKKTPKEKQGNNKKLKKIEQTKSEVKVKETIRMQKTCTYQSVTTVNTHGTNSSVVPVSHVGMTTNISKTKKTVVTDEECKNKLNYSSGTVMNNSYCLTSDSPCTMGHHRDCCKLHTHAQIIPIAHVQTCSIGHGINRTSDSSSSSSHCEGSFPMHRFGHQQSIIYSPPTIDYGCCCSGSLMQNVHDTCLVRKKIVAYSHHLPHHTHLSNSTFGSDGLCTDYHHAGSPALDAARHHHAQHFSLSPPHHSRMSCCSCNELHRESNQHHHQSTGSCLQFLSSPKSSASLVPCEQSPLDLSLASAGSNSSADSDIPFQAGQCPSPLCCRDLLLLRTSTPHGCQASQFPVSKTCCKCDKSACENAMQCSRNSVLRLEQPPTPANHVGLLTSAVSQGSVLPIVSASSVTTKNVPQITTDNLVSTKREKSVSPKQSSKLTASKKRQFEHGWSWKGKPREKLISLTNDSVPCLRLCYPSVQHKEGDTISERDCVLLRSGPKDTDLPYVAKIATFWENPDDGEMMMSLLWYYRPEHTDQGRKPGQVEDEVFASRHKDVNSVACIEDKCYVLTYNEYCRYRASLTMEEDTISKASMLVPDLPDGYSRRDRLPSDAVSSDIVFFCRHVYDFRQKRILKNPT